MRPRARERLSNQIMTGLVQTVLGPVKPEDLGYTTTHEHLLIDLTCLLREPAEASGRLRSAGPVDIGSYGWTSYDAFRNRDNLELLNEDVAASEAMLYKRAGGQTIVDVTSIGIGRDPKALARIARATGLHVIVGAGYYVEEAHPTSLPDMSEAEVAQELVNDIRVGVEDTEVRAGIIGELGCSWPLTPDERKVLKAAASAQRETGAAVSVHPGRNPRAPFEILDILAEAGADVERVVMCHLGRTFREVDDVLELAARGCYLEYDGFGWETSYYPLSTMDTPNDSQRIAFVKRLVDEGHGSRIVIAQDICTKHRTSKYGGHGYAHILNNVVSRMREAGISEEAVEKILVQNPARLLACAIGMPSGHAPRDRSTIASR